MTETGDLKEALRILIEYATLDELDTVLDHLQQPQVPQPNASPDECLNQRIHDRQQLQETIERLRRGHVPIGQRLTKADHARVVGFLQRAIARSAN